jgi:hypothetical protein|tara:strand:+ start:127 stop:342 length:216 start_codon:yes stop_codon:yes gene_type:complete
MSSQYKANNFSAESLSTTLTGNRNNTSRTVKPNIENLLKRIHVERKREKKNITTLGVIFLLIVLTICFFQI